MSKEPDGSVVSADVGALQPRPFASWTAFGFLHKNLVNRIWVTCSCWQVQSSTSGGAQGFGVGLEIDPASVER